MAISLASISKSTALRAPRIVLIGGEKVGKSTFASEAPNPVFIPVKGEEGIDGIGVSGFPVCTSYAELMEMLGVLYFENHQYQTVVLDSASTLEPLLIAEALRREGKSSQAELGGGFGHQDDTLMVLYKEITDAFDTLRDQKNMASIIISHVTVTQFKDPQSEPYDIYEMDLRKKPRNLLYRWADSILFAHRKPALVKKDDAGFNKKHNRAFGDDVRVLYTQKRPTHPGGGRRVYGWLPYELEFSWAAFQDAVAVAAAQAEASDAQAAAEAANS